MTTPSQSIERAAPASLLGGPLTGITVIELVRAAPGEFVGMMLSDMGAQVLRIETPNLDALHGQEDARRSAHTYTNRNKRSMALDLKSPEGQAIFKRLATGADVVIEGFRPGVMQRLGVGHATLSSLNPRLVMCSMSGFGQSGPYRDLPAHDINFLAIAGVLALLGQPGGPPAIPLNLVADYGGASMHAALGIVLALFARERTGRGQHVDISYLDSTLALLAATPNLRGLFSDGQVSGRGEGVVSGTYPFYTVYDTLDGKQLSVGCTEAHLWQNFCEAIGLPDLVRFQRRPDHFKRTANVEERAAREQIAAVIKTRTRDDWQALLVSRNVAIGPVNEPAEAAADPQLLHRQMVVDIEHPEHGVVRQVGIAIKLSDTPGAVQGVAPRSGEHTDAVLRELGYGDRDIAAMRARAVVA